MPKELRFRERSEKTLPKAKLRVSVPKRRKSTNKQAEWYVKAHDQIAITSGASGGVTLWIGRADNIYDDYD